MKSNDFTMGDPRFLSNSATGHFLGQNSDQNSFDNRHNLKCFQERMDTSGQDEWPELFSNFIKSLNSNDQDYEAVLYRSIEILLKHVKKLTDKDAGQRLLDLLEQFLKYRSFQIRAKTEGLCEVIRDKFKSRKSTDIETAEADWADDDQTAQSESVIASSEPERESEPAATASNSSREPMTIGRTERLNPGRLAKSSSHNQVMNMLGNFLQNKKPSTESVCQIEEQLTQEERERKELAALAPSLNLQREVILQYLLSIAKDNVLVVHGISVEKRIIARELHGVKSRNQAIEFLKIKVACYDSGNPADNNTVNQAFQANQNARQQIMQSLGLLTAADGIVNIPQESVAILQELTGMTVPASRDTIISVPPPVAPAIMPSPAASTMGSSVPAAVQRQDPEPTPQINTPVPNNPTIAGGTTSSVSNRRQQPALAHDQHLNQGAGQATSKQASNLQSSGSSIVAIPTLAVAAFLVWLVYKNKSKLLKEEAQKDVKDERLASPITDEQELVTVIPSKSIETQEELVEESKVPTDEDMEKKENSSLEDEIVNMN